MAESPHIFEIDESNYEQIVLQGSHDVPVLLDFWASWCQPCQILMPVLAKLVEEYQGRFILAKINTEEQQEIASRFGIHSIPTVKLFRDGQPVDEFAGALPESEIRAFLDRHMPRASDGSVVQAEERLHAGDPEGALALLSQAREDDPGNPRVLMTMAQIQAATGDRKEIQVLAGQTLAYLNSPNAQRTIANVALSDSDEMDVRIAAFASLANSAKLQGNLLADDVIDRIYGLVSSDQTPVDLRAAAAAAYGSLNLPSQKVKDLILDQAKS